MPMGSAPASVLPINQTAVCAQPATILRTSGGASFPKLSADDRFCILKKSSCNWFYYILRQTRCFKVQCLPFLSNTVNQSAVLTLHFKTSCLPGNFPSTLIPRTWTRQQFYCVSCEHSLNCNFWQLSKATVSLCFLHMFLEFAFP